MTVKATDKDDGDNGRLTYHLKEHDKNVQENAEFIIDKNNGELRTKILLDRELQSKYEVCQECISTLFHSIIILNLCSTVSYFHCNDRVSWKLLILESCGFRITVFLL